MGERCVKCGAESGAHELCTWCAVRITREQRDGFEQTLRDIDARLHATHEANLPRGFTCTCVVCVYPDAVAWLVDEVRASLAKYASEPR